MANKDELARLRAEVRARHRAAGNKVSRLRARGVELAGTGYDVRRNAANIKKYNTRQLKSYLNELNSFNARTNGFVAGDSGVPLPAAKWREYKRLEKKYNQIGNREYEKVGDTFLPQAGVKVRDRRKMLSQSALGEAVHSPYQEINRRARGIVNEQALDKLTEQMRGKTSRDYLPGEIAKSREQFMDMLKEIGNPEYIDAANKLSDDQFDTLWNYTSFASEVSSDYEIMKMKARGEEERAHAKIHKDNSDSISELLQWAELLPERKRRR